MLEQRSTKPLKRQLRPNTSGPSALAKPSAPSEAKSKAGEDRTRPRKRRPEGVVPLTHSEDEAAIRAGCGQSTIRRAIDAGDLKARKMFGRTVITEADLTAWIDALPVRAPKPKAA